ncbi:uncharacterized protein LOC135978506 [Chrysemys picta bellii]|uniref:uncharacterized protein LOC135978506 n=1 Tax=Chrysemys picta bellii TaxID=8478 RepID=UPI0032B30E5A
MERTRALTWLKRRRACGRRRVQVDGEDAGFDLAECNGGELAAEGGSRWMQRTRALTWLKRRRACGRRRVQVAAEDAGFDLAECSAGELAAEGGSRWMQRTRALTWLKRRRACGRRRVQVDAEDAGFDLAECRENFPILGAVDLPGQGGACSPEQKPGTRKVSTGAEFVFLPMCLSLSSHMLANILSLSPCPVSLHRMWAMVHAHRLEFPYTKEETKTGKMQA